MISYLNFKKNLTFLIIFFVMFTLSFSACNSGEDFPFEYELGDEGPGGGKVFYRSAAGFIVEGEDINKIYHYLEAALADIPTELAWASGGFIDTSIPGLLEHIGTGKENTKLILYIDPNAPAAKACKDFDGGGLDDWFLPSKWELEMLIRNRDFVDNIPDTSNYLDSHRFWSSTQYAYDYSHFINRAYHSHKQIYGEFVYYSALKDSLYWVRPVRAF